MILKLTKFSFCEKWTEMFLQEAILLIKRE